MPGPEYWHPTEQRRRKLAERLAWDLAHLDPAAPGGLSDFVAATVVRVRWESAIDAHVAFDQAGTLLAVGGEYRLIEGRGGAVLVLHCPQGGMDDWSLVVRYEPFRTPVLVCLDDMGEHCMGVYADSPPARQALSDLRVRLILLKANELPHVSVRVLPTSAGPHRASVSGAFTILEFPAINGEKGEPSTVYSESLTRPSILTVRKSCTYTSKPGLLCRPSY